MVDNCVKLSSSSVTTTVVAWLIICINLFIIKIVHNVYIKATHSYPADR